ncbi:MAG: TorF family putative porin [Hyphomicrobiaceae bacterium]
MIKSNFGTLGAAALALLMGTGVALADGMGSVKDSGPPPDEGRKFGFSWNIGVTSDYVFRGVSQNAGDPTVQGGVDFTYGMLYAGVWGSGVDFGPNAAGNSLAHAEMDIYGGIKPVWGPVTFDFGVIYYTYPSARDGNGLAPEQDMVEFKVGASGSFVPNLTTGVTVFMSPNYTGEQGLVTTVEGTAGYELPKFYGITPTIGGTLGGVFGDASDASKPFIAANGKDSYMYWNAGLTLGIDKLAIDFRYWDTDISNGSTGFCSADLFGCDERFVASAKVTF